MGEQERGAGGGAQRRCERVSGGLLMAGVDAQPESPCSSWYSSPEKEQERLRRRAALWRGLRPLRLPSALILLLAVLLCTERWPGAASVWPICYDYYVPDQINENAEAGCPLRSADGTLQNTKESLTPCYHTAPWDITSPAPDCRDEGCLKDDDKACCCGASGDRVMGRLDPAVESAPESSGLCSEETWGKFHESGASAGSCRSCRSGQGAENGIGGRIAETYGDPSLKGAFDPQVFGHVETLDYKLVACPTAIRKEFADEEMKVNVACDVKTYYRLKRCGNCAQAICDFHNNLHWVSDPYKKCMRDLFLRRMECYARWYHKWCTCKEFSSIPYEGKQGDWESQCVEPKYFNFVPNRDALDRIPTRGTYPRCSSAPAAGAAWRMTSILAFLASFQLLRPDA